MNECNSNPKFGCVCVCGWAVIEDVYMRVTVVAYSNVVTAVSEISKSGTFVPFLPFWAFWLALPRSTKDCTKNNPDFSMSPHRVCVISTCLHPISKAGDES